MTHLPSPANCPVCGSRPDIGICEPWPRGDGPQPFYAICYRGGDDEHCIGVNGDNQRDAIKAWNKEVCTFQRQD